jgi:hypothetical protein
MKVLFYCPDYLGIYKIIEKGIIENTSFEVKTVLFNNYKHKNKYKKLLNFISKLILNKNLKKKWASEFYANQIDDLEVFDYVFIISPDHLLSTELEYVTSKAKKSIVYFWDSFKLIDRYERTLPFFDVKFSFEPNDVKKHNMSLLTNFYFDTIVSNKNSSDAYYIGNFDDRISTIEKINLLLLKSGLKPDIYIKINSKTKVNKFSENINFITSFIPFEENQQKIKESKIILDIHKNIQDGLTFRVFEAIGLNKKLITTNKDIVNYDFYNPNNIFVWDENVTEIPKDFLEKEYEKLSDEIYKKYSLENWVKTIFNITKIE